MIDIRLINCRRSTLLRQVARYNCRALRGFPLLLGECQGEVIAAFDFLSMEKRNVVRGFSLAWRP
jgi:hypothetical protein